MAQHRSKFVKRGTAQLSCPLSSLPQVEPLLTVIAAVVTTVATGVGVVVALGQLTLRARLKRTVETTKALLAAESDQHRKRVLTSVHDIAVARLVAGWVVPWWLFVEVVATLLLGPVGVGLGAARSGWSTGLLTFCLSSVAAFGIPARRATRVYLERQRIVRQYVARQPIEPVRLGILGQMEGGTRGEFVFGLLVATGATMAALGTGLLIHRSDPTASLLLLVAGLGVASSPVSWLRRHAIRPLNF